MVPLFCTRSTASAAFESSALLKSATAGDTTTGRERYGERQCVRYHWPKESATRAIAEGASLDVEVTQIERGSHDHLPESRGSLARSTAAGGALVGEVPPAEKPAESAAKEHQCVRHHRSKERKKSAKRGYG